MEKFSVARDVSVEDLADILITGFEGGIGYWACIEDYIEPKNAKEISGCRYADYPLTGGGVILSVTDEEEQYTLDGAAIRRGLQSLTPKQMRFLDTMDCDASDADQFIQMCLFGKVIFG
tara:strand:- start:3197 stop:3553 length:357 start_codon:yes stop_codon:yes gene_type:complete